VKSRCTSSVSQKNTDKTNPLWTLHTTLAEKGNFKTTTQLYSVTLAGVSLAAQQRLSNTLYNGNDHDLQRQFSFGLVLYSDTLGNTPLLEAAKNGDERRLTESYTCNFHIEK